MQALIGGQVTAITSPLLIDELRGVLYRQRFRRWVTVEECDEFVEALREIGDAYPDARTSAVDLACRDPKDRYLVALTQHVGAHYLVSGDKDLQEMKHPYVIVRSAKQVLNMLRTPASWGPGFVHDNEPEDAMRQAAAEGHESVLNAASIFLHVMDAEHPEQYLPAIVTPESLANWLDDLDSVRRATFHRGLATRPEYPLPGVAYVKLPPEPDQAMRVTAHVMIPDAIILTLQHRPDLTDSLDVGGWKIHSIGDYCPIELLPQVN